MRREEEEIRGEELRNVEAAFFRLFLTQTYFSDITNHVEWNNCFWYALICIIISRFDRVLNILLKYQELVLSAKL